MRFPNNMILIGIIVQLICFLYDSFSNAFLRFRGFVDHSSLYFCVSGSLPPSRKRSLFVLATSMIIFSSKAYNIPSLVPRVKAALSDKTVSNQCCQALYCFADAFWWSVIVLSIACQPGFY